jgi:hypothetical protein
VGARGRRQGIPGQRHTRRTKIPDPKAPPVPDLVERNFTAERPNALWLADITHEPTLNLNLIVTRAGQPSLLQP